MVRVHSPVAREVSQHALVFVIPVAPRHARALSRAGSTRMKEPCGRRYPRTHTAFSTSAPALHIGVTIRRLDDDNYWTPPPPPGYQRRRTRFTGRRGRHLGGHTHRSNTLNTSASASCLEKQSSSSQLGSEVMPDASPTRCAPQPQPRLPRRIPQCPPRNTAAVACEWRSPVAPASPCRCCGDSLLSAGESTCSSSGTELSITLVARKSPRRHLLECHDDSPSMPPAHVRVYKSSGHRSSAQHPLAKRAEAAKAGEGGRPKTAPLSTAPSKQPATAPGRCSEWKHAARGHSGCLIPAENTICQPRAHKAHPQLVKKSEKCYKYPTAEPPKSAAGDYYSKSIITMKMNPTDARGRLEKVHFVQTGDHSVRNSKNCDKLTAELSGRRNDTRGIREMKNKCASSADCNVPTGKMDGSCGDKTQTKKPEAFNGWRITGGLSISPRDSNHTIRRSLGSGVPPLVGPIPSERSARLLHRVTKSEEDLLKEISKVTKPVFMRHIDKTNRLKRREGKTIDPAPLKALRRVDSFTQTSEEVAMKEDGIAEDDSEDRALPALPHEDYANGQARAAGVNNLTKSKDIERDKVPLKVGYILRNSSKFTSLRATSSDSMQKNNSTSSEAVEDAELPGSPATPKEVAEGGEERADASLDREPKDLAPLLSSPPPSRRSSAFHLGRPKRPSGAFVSAMAREFEQSIANAASLVPREQVLFKGDDACAASTRTTARLSVTRSRQNVERLRTEHSHGKEDAWEEPPLPPLPARSKSLSPAKRRGGPKGKVDGARS